MTSAFNKIITILTSLEGSFTSLDGKLIYPRSLYAIDAEAPDDPGEALNATTTSGPGAFYQLSAGKLNYPDGATMGVMFGAAAGFLLLVANNGVHLYTVAGGWVEVAGGGWDRPSRFRARSMRP